MFTNYKYFITIAEEGNISHAAAKLFVSHQCLSKYLNRLEKKYNVSLFDRSTKLTLTPAGQVFYSAALQLQEVEETMNIQLDDIHQAKRGILRFGTTEARYRILIPQFLAEYKKMYPKLILKTEYSSTENLRNAILKNELDIALLNQSAKPHSQLDMRPVLEEKLHLAISDNMLKQFFPDRYPACIEEFHQGVHLKDFKHVPFVFSSKEKNMVTKVLQPFLQFNRIQLTKVDPVSQSDMQYLLTAKDYAACFCWSMFIPSIRQENRNPEHSHIYIFPVKDEIETNRLMMVTRKGKIFQKYGKDFMRMVKNTCIAYAETDPEDE